MNGSERRKPITKTLARAAAVAAAIAVLGFAAMTGGLNLAGVSPGGALLVARAEQVAPPQAEAPQDEAQQNVQKVRTSLENGFYEPITVTAGIPVEWTIDAPEDALNYCNYLMVIPAFGIEHEFTQGENVIRFTPDVAGTYPYSCWMGMIESTITVLEPGAAAPSPAAPAMTVPPIYCPHCY